MSVSEILQAIGAILILISIAGLAFRTYRLFFCHSKRPIVEIYIILIGFFSVGLLGMWLIISTRH